MRILTILATQPVPIAIGIKRQTTLHVEDVEVSPETLKARSPAQLTLRLDSADPKTMVRVNWFGPSGWSLLETEAPALSQQMRLTVPSQIFSEPGTYRAEVRIGNVYEGEAKLSVTG